MNTGCPSEGHPQTCAKAAHRPAVASGVSRNDLRIQASHASVSRERTLGLQDWKVPETTQRRSTYFRPALGAGARRAAPRGPTARGPSACLTLFSRPSRTSMPLWLRYSSRRLTRPCSPSILVSRLLCRGKSRQPSGLREGCKIKQLLGRGASQSPDDRALPFKRAGMCLAQRGAEASTFRVCGTGLMLRVKGLRLKHSLFLDVLREAPPRLT